MSEERLNCRMPVKSLGAFLREKRREEGFAIRKLVEVIKSMSASDLKVTLSPAYICDIENGRRTPSDEVLSLLAKALNITDDEIELYDTRVPNQEIQELAQMNALYGVAFRRMVKHIQQHAVAPEDLLQAMIDKFEK